MITFAILSIALLSSCSAQNENIVKSYSKEEFLSQLDNINNFVMFYAPWCSHCKRLMPVWEDLAKDFEENNNLAIAKVDCTVQTELCSNQDITGYPTLKLYKIGENEGKKFKGSRDLQALRGFIRDELGEIKESLNAGGDAEQEPLVELNDDNFEKHVAEGNHFVKFFAPWCSHCQTLAPKWHALAEALKDNEEVTIAKVDCTKNHLCSAFDVMSYPTLLWIKDGKKVDVYQGARSPEELQEYVSKMLQPVHSKEPEDTKDTLDVGKSVIALTDDNFQFHIENGFTFVKFFAPWCGHCKRLAPTWEELAQKLSAEGKIKIAHVDCTLEDNKDLCNDQEVEGYPTLFFYRNGAKISEYNGSRVLEDLLEFVKRHSSHDEL
ncbi:LOW QUALITY PROTEIN: thioredoxin domain-containing protein 5 homolog [Homalodisca vitripennis]|nr:LOW QUALITY PROTEIN: thioredoxin domain-containing protein 5 homolog [Homalodisca vitripennis]